MKMEAVKKPLGNNFMSNFLAPNPYFISEVLCPKNSCVVTAAKGGEQAQRPLMAGWVISVVPPYTEYSPSEGRTS